MTNNNPSPSNVENTETKDEGTVVCKEEKKHPEFCWREDDPPYVKNRLGRFIDYFYYEKQKSRRKERIYQYVIISLGGLIPIINVLGLGTLPVNYASAIFGAGISFLTAILAFEKYHERWLSFKQAATKLSNEYYMWKNSTGDYAPFKKKKDDDTKKRR